MANTIEFVASSNLVDLSRIKDQETKEVLERMNEIINSLSLQLAHSKEILGSKHIGIEETDTNITISYI